MGNDSDHVIAAILHAEDSFLIEIGRLTLLFSRIEDSLLQDALYLSEFSSDAKLKEEATPARLAQLRLMEKRDFVKRVVAEIGRFYSVDHSCVGKILDELGNINRLRRTVVHGWIRWSEADKTPVLVDSHGHSVRAWPRDVAHLNLKVLTWFEEYHSEQKALAEAVLDAYDAFADRLLRHPRLSAHQRDILRGLKK